jgi:hypothetical protein
MRSGMGAGWFIGGVVLSGLSAGHAGAAHFATEYTSYVPGDMVEEYRSPSVALGKPSPQMSWDYVLTPFNAHWEGSQIVGIGGGGSLTLRFPAPVPTNGYTIGVHAGVGLIDTSWPIGQNDTPAAYYNASRSAEVRVSENGQDWQSLGLVVFNIPTNYYSAGITLPGSQTTPGTVEADFFKPFTGSLSDFDGKDWAGTLEVLDGSAGGRWLDLSGTGLPAVNYIQFNVGQDQVMYVDAVAAIPEPATGLLLLGTWMLLIRRRRN